MRFYIGAVVCLLLAFSSSAWGQVTRDRAKTWEIGALVNGT